MPGASRRAFLGRALACLALTLPSAPPRAARARTVADLIEPYSQWCDDFLRRRHLGLPAPDMRSLARAPRATGPAAGACHDVPEDDRPDSQDGTALVATGARRAPRAYPDASTVPIPRIA